MSRALFIITLAIAASTALAAPPASKRADTPRDLWIKAKCALCHGEDGSGDTPTGRKTSTPDLTTEDIQKKSDEELAKCIEKGHEKMPAFHVRLLEKEREILLRYVRDLAKRAP